MSITVKSILQKENNSLYSRDHERRDKMVCAELTVSEKCFLEQNIFQATAQIGSNYKRPHLKSTHS